MGFGVEGRKMTGQINGCSKSYLVFWPTPIFGVLDGFWRFQNRLFHHVSWVDQQQIVEQTSFKS